MMEVTNMEISKIKLMLVILFGGAGVFVYTSDPMEVDKKPHVHTYVVGFTDALTKKRDFLDVYNGMKYAELDGYLKGKLDIPIETRLKVALNVDAISHINLSEHPDRRLTGEELYKLLNTPRVMVFRLE